MTVNTIIGGEFECVRYNENLSLKTLSFKPYTFSAGRTALYNIIIYCKEQLQSKIIFLPDYLCDSIVDAVHATEMVIDFYHVSEKLLPEWKSISDKLRNGGVILFIDYFGIIDNEPEIKKIKQYNENVVVIKDLVQAPYHINENSLADFQFTSFRKSFAVPDGAWVITKHQIRQPLKAPKFAEYKIAASYLKSMRHYGDFSDEIYLDLYAKGECLVGSDMDEDMSDFTKQHISNMDWKRFSLLRKRNAKMIVDGLSTLGIQPIAIPQKTSIPLFIPIALHNRDKVRQKMFDSNIFLPVHWQIDDNFSQKYKLTTGAKYAKEELSIIVDQRYGTADMTRILETLEKALK